jgi:FtsP/CotA-like multicopper oxidase with cupredoxin domain
MIAIEQGDSHTYSYEIPENHPSGLLWMHPHYHGSTSLSMAGGAALPVLILPDEKDATNLEKYDPTSENIHILALQSWAVEQEQNPTTEPTNNNWEATKTDASKPVLRFNW